jgi:hypothetical protein
MGRDCVDESAVVAAVMAELEIQESYHSWILSLVRGATREAPSCCGNACRPCTLTIDAAVLEARRRIAGAARESGRGKGESARER